MRTIERERLNQLQSKQKSGEPLSDAEKTRLLKLEAQLSREGSTENDGRNNKQTGGHNAASGGDLASVGHNEGSGEGLGESESDEQGNGSKLDSITSTDFGQAGNSDGPDRIGCGSSGSTISESGNSDGQDGGIDGSDHNESGSGRREKTGRNNNRQTEKENLRESVDISPKDVKPKRQSSAKGKTVEISTADLYGAFISGTFQTVAFASGKTHWIISDEEAASIAKPLDQVLSKLSSKQKKAIEKYTAPAMLGMALAGVVVPRIMYDLNESRRAKNNVGSKPKIVASVTNDLPTDNIVKQHGGSSPDVPGSAPNVDKAIAGLFETGH